MATYSVSQLSDCLSQIRSDSDISEPDSQWYAIRVRPRCEKAITAAISGKEYETFLPVQSQSRKWSDRVKSLEVPLFPGYVFCRGELARKPRLVSIPGVIGILRFAGVPAVISEAEIAALKAVVRSGVLVEPWAYVREGERVRVHSGLLTGVEGILIRTKGDYRVVLSVEMICRSVAVEVNRDSIAPVSSPFLT
jgi:transcription antitermination factor NusG